MRIDKKTSLVWEEAKETFHIAKLQSGYIYNKLRRIGQALCHV